MNIPFKQYTVHVIWINRSRNESIHGSPQKTHRFFEMVTDDSQKDEKK